TSVEMRFPGYELNGPEGTMLYDIYRVNSDNTVVKLTAASTSDTDYQYKLDNPQRFGMYTISSNMAPLPVELVSFKAVCQAEGGVLLTWLTASEKDNQGFEVQTSANGRNFSRIGFVKSNVVNSSVAQQYSFLDNTATAAGIRYYRLAQTDLDGTITYSNIKAVDIPTDAQVNVLAYPNPFSAQDQVTVQLPSGPERQVRVVIANALGQVLQEEQAAVQNRTLPVNMASAATKGMYVLYVIDSDKKYTFRMIRR
ncbi:MAG: T9SS type A sorting domain-containing protein, partial [Hymenobacteraceae bacterium]|nr:T9SS type A sorting domain-containing protein [Hymenobacteraceae bacterium]